MVDLAKKKRDHSTFDLKVALRRDVLDRIDGDPLIMETHGGFGRLWASLYAGGRPGVVFEKDEAKAAYLGRQRPAWRVYEADCELALAAGACADVVVDVLDVDPHGSAWDTITAFLRSDRELAPEMWIVVQDGLGVKLRAGGAWHVGAIVEMVDMWGNDDLTEHYVDGCKMLIEKRAREAGYGLARFAGYPCGYVGSMTHFAAFLSK